MPDIYNMTYQELRAALEESWDNEVDLRAKLWKLSHSVMRDRKRTYTGRAQDMMLWLAESMTEEVSDETD